MHSTQTQPSFASDSDTKIKHPYIDYTIGCLLLINVALILFLAYKLFRLWKRKPKSNFDRRNRRYRVFIFILIFLALVLRACFEGDQIYSTLKFDSSTHVEPVVLMIDVLPSLLFVSIACAFSYFWFELYSSFSDDFETMEYKSIQYKRLLVSVNALLYLTFISSSVFHVLQESKACEIIVRSMCILGLIFSTVMLKIHGSRLYDRAIKLVIYTGSTVKSSNGFRTIYITLLVCCVLKWIKEGLLLGFSISAGEDLLQDLDGIQGGFSLPVFVCYVIVFYVFGEYGVFVSLILLLDAYANKSRASFGESSESGRASESYLLENEKNNIQTAYNSFIQSSRQVQHGDVSVNFTQ